MSDGDLQVVPFTVAAGASSLKVRLEWDGDWISCATNDLDVILVDPNGSPDFSAATLDSPERTAIDNPTAGTWLALVDGTSIATKGVDRYKRRIVVDGKVVRSRAAGRPTNAPGATRVASRSGPCRPRRRISKSSCTMDNSQGRRATVPNGRDAPNGTRW